MPYPRDGRWDCHTQKVIAPIKRAACTQSLIGLPLSRTAEMIIAAAQAMAQSTRVVNCFLDAAIKILLDHSVTAFEGAQSILF
jgi:hypothetical protein